MVLQDILVFDATAVNVRDKRVIVRVDFNVPVAEKRVVDDYRIVKTLPLLQNLKEQGARLVLLSHLTEKKEHRSFESLLHELERICGFPLSFARTIAEARDSSADVVLLENLRVFPGEEANDEAFAKELAALGDIYVNEDFSQSHRPYASIISLPHVLSSYAGPLFGEEVKKLQEVFEPEHPFMLMLGGVKFQTKVGVLDHFLEKADAIFIGGALANTFLASRGVEVGNSRIEQGALLFIQKTFGGHPKIVLPVDVRVGAGSGVSVRRIGDVHPDETIYDIGPETSAMLKEKIKDMRMVLWNGPLGFTEKGFRDGTEQVLADLAAATHTRVIIGGGDTISTIRKQGFENAFYHLSTGGGAMLEFLAKGTLPGIEALKSQNM